MLQVASACGVSRHAFSRFGTKDKVAPLADSSTFLPCRGSRLYFQAAVTQQFVVARDLDAAFIAQRCSRLQVCGTPRPS
jgi:hypothetical protein